MQKMTEPTTGIANAPSPGFQAMMKFCLDHSGATLLLRVATQDYAAARCLAHHHLPASLILGAQAFEKYMKAYLLLDNPSRDVQKYGHRLSPLLRDVDGIAPHLSLSRFNPLAEKFKSHYQTRYPGNPGASTTMTTADIFELDEMIILLNESMPCPKTVRYRTGLYAAITLSLNQTATPTEHWIKNNNRALAPLLPRIEQDHREVMRMIHPPA
jgi:hypothetical protein